MKKSIAGFTLVELIIVIAIVSILAAVALPKFIAAQQQARFAKQQMILGAVRSAANLAHAACVLDMATSAAPTCTTAGGTVTMEGTVINMANQYPTAASIQASTQLAAGTDNITVTAVGATMTFTVPGGTGCTVTYTPAAAGNMPTFAATAVGTC